MDSCGGVKEFIEKIAYNLKHISYYYLTSLFVLFNSPKFNIDRMSPLSGMGNILTNLSCLAREILVVWHGKYCDKSEFDRQGNTLF